VIINTAPKNRSVLLRIKTYEKLLQDMHPPRPAMKITSQIIDSVPSASISHGKSPHAMAAADAFDSFARLSSLANKKINTTPAAKAMNVIVVLGSPNALKLPLSRWFCILMMIMASGNAKKYFRQFFRILRGASMFCAKQRRLTALNIALT